MLCLKALLGQKSDYDYRGHCHEAERAILIDSTEKDPREFLGTLLHEMADAKVYLDGRLKKNADSHGPRFVAELERLRKAGEWHLLPQIRRYSRELECGRCHRKSSATPGNPNHPHDT